MEMREREGKRSGVGKNMWGGAGGSQKLGRFAHLDSGCCCIDAIDTRGIRTGERGGRNGRETRDNKKDARDDWEEIRFLRCE